MKKFNLQLVLAIILVILIISIGIYMYCEKEVIVASNITKFKYSREIIIDNSQNSNNLNDYQILVTIDTSYLISNNYLKSDCSDIRFLDSDKNTLLNYWIESGCNTNNTKIWVKVNIPANSNKIIYFVSGNEILNSASNGDLVFDFFDDFEGTSLNTSKWTLGYAQFKGANVTIFNSMALILTSNNDTLQAIHSNYIIGQYDKKIIEAKVQIPTTSRTSKFLYLVSSGNVYRGGFGMMWVDGAIGGEYSVIGLEYYFSPFTQIENNSFIARITKNDTYSFDARVLDLEYNTVGRTFSTTQTAWNFDWWISGWVYGTESFYWDWVRVRKYTSPEPKVSLGNELGSFVLTAK